MVVMVDVKWVLMWGDRCGWVGGGVAMSGDI